MFTYTYKVVSKDRGSYEDTARAWSSWWLRRTLRKKGLIVVAIHRKYAARASMISLAHVASMSSYTQILFFRNFSMMLESGITISHALETLANQVKGMGVRDAIGKIRHDVMNGRTLSSSMEKVPRLFPRHIVKTIEVGERSGALATTLDRISVDLEKNYELRRKVIGAIAYPVIILIFMIITAFLLVIFVLPQLTAMFNELGAPVPPMTLYLQSVGTFILAYPLQLAGAALAAFVAFTLLMRIRSVRHVVHRTFLQVPIFGPLVLEYNLIRLTRALNTLVASGITFTHAIESSKGTLNNEAFKCALERIYPIVLHGGSFSDAISTHPYLFPDQLRQMVIVGEQSGRLGFALEKVSVHYERSVQFQTQMLTTVIEPILMLIAGVLVGSLAYSMFAPLYSVTSYI
jgi:type IV pilus assembly protein PilC